jgi:hypothetical protein
MDESVTGSVNLFYDRSTAGVDARLAVDGQRRVGATRCGAGVVITDPATGVRRLERVYRRRDSGAQARPRDPLPTTEVVRDPTTLTTSAITRVVGIVWQDSSGATSASALSTVAA